MSNKVDLEALARLPTFSGTIERQETEAEIAARLAREKAESDAKLWKDKVSFVAALVCSIALGGSAFYFAVNGTGEVQKWAMSLATGVAGIRLGFMTGKAKAKADD